MIKKKCNHPHVCPEWDFLFILPDDEEFQSCLCECDEEPNYEIMKEALSTYEVALLNKWIKENE